MSPSVIDGCPPRGRGDPTARFGRKEKEAGLEVLPLFLARTGGGSVVSERSKRSDLPAHTGRMTEALAKAGAPLTATEKRLLAHLERSFPLEADPYRWLAQELGLSAEEVFSLTAELCRRGVIRRLGPIFDAQGLGYLSTLLAVEVARESLEEVVRHVNHFPEVTHNYLREHQLNLWAAVVAPNPERLREVIGSIRGLAGVRRVLELPVRRRYKLRLVFPLVGVEEAGDAG